MKRNLHHGLPVTMFSSFTVIKRFMRTPESWPCFPELSLKALCFESRQKGPVVPPHHGGDPHRAARALSTALP